jgi:hypothetical protein
MVTRAILMMNVDSCDRKGELRRRLVIATGWPTDDDDRSTYWWHKTCIYRYMYACISIVSTCAWSSSSVAHLSLTHTNDDLDRSHSIWDSTSRWYKRAELSSFIINRSVYVVITIFWQAESSQAAKEWFIDERWRWWWWCETWPISTSEKASKRKEQKRCKWDNDKWRSRICVSTLIHMSLFEWR